MILYYFDKLKIRANEQHNLRGHQLSHIHDAPCRRALPLRNDQILHLEDLLLPGTRVPQIVADCFAQDAVLDRQVSAANFFGGIDRVLQGAAERDKKLKDPQIGYDIAFCLQGFVLLRQCQSQQVRGDGETHLQN